MNGSYFKNPTFPNAKENEEDTINYTANIENQLQDGILDIEQSYIENVLRQNKGKKVKVYASFSDSTSWRDRMFEGTIEEASRDHLIVRLLDGRWILIPSIYMDYVEFEDKINYLFKKDWINQSFCYYHYF